jgi:hypothetical protein
VTVAAVGAPARFATPRTESRPTRGHEVAEVMGMLGYDPMPWQRQVLDVALEVDDDGELVYREVVLVVPRQAGKTSILLGVQVHRALAFGRSQASFYTAQTRNHARSKFVDEHLPILESSEFGGLFTKRLALGSEAVLWHNGSMHGIGAPTKDAGHGGSLDLAQIDEAFALTDDRLEQGLKPTMITRRSPQTWIVSAAGDDDSVYLKAKLEVGRERARLGQATGSAYFEWSADDDMPADDPATWWACHPALGFTITEKAIASDFESMPLAEFERAYLARWPGKRHSRVITTEEWAACLDPESKMTDPVTLAVDVSPDRSWSTVSAAGARADGGFGVEVLRSEAGTAWVVPFVVAALAKNKGAVVALDGGSAAASLLPDFAVARVEPTVLGMRDVVRGTGFFYDSAVAGTLRHRGQVALDTAVAGAKKRLLGDAWAWGRTAGVDITPLVSATLALWAHTNRPPSSSFGWQIA